MSMSAELCYAALRARDARYDGRLFFGVRSTGIYCRPVCPAATPRPEHCTFFASAAAAQQAGFRPCLRCRPEAAPSSGAWRGTSSTVSRGLRLIEEGALDGEGASVEVLAGRLGVGGRQLRRLFQRHLGASPLAVAQTRRVLFAKQLICESQLSMADIANAAGFGSVRRFNESFRSLFGRPPGQLRRTRGARGQGAVTLRLAYRPPLDWEGLLAQWRARAVAGVEEVTAARYRRTLRVGGEAVLIELGHLPRAQQLSLVVRLPRVATLGAVVARARAACDLDADVAGIEAELCRDPWLRPLVARRPGLRVAGGWDGFEAGARIVLDQRPGESAAAGSALARALVECCGEPMAVPSEDHAGPGWLFPTAAQVLAADLSSLPLAASSRRALLALAEASLSDPSIFDPRPSLGETLARFREIRGVSEWTAQMMALTVVREPDAFPTGDPGLQRALGARSGSRGAALIQRSERWRPWRAYAAQHLWAADALREDPARLGAA